MANTAAVLHYQHLARQASALRAAQARWDNQAEPEADDDALSEDDARDQASAWVLGHAEPVADWLAKACDCAAGRQPVDMSAVDEFAVIDGNVPLLLAVLMLGDDCLARRAMHRLRDLADAAFNADIEQRAQKLLRRNQLELAL